MSTTHHGLLIHVIFSTKLRYPLIRDSWRDDLFAYMGGIARDHKATLLASGGIEDHVHLLIKINPSFAIADTVKLIKANSSRWINEARKVDGSQPASHSRSAKTSPKMPQRRELMPAYSAAPDTEPISSIQTGHA